MKTSISCLLVLVVVMGAAMAASTVAAPPEEGALSRYHGRRRRRNRPGGWTPTPPAPPATPVVPAPGRGVPSAPPSPPAPGFLLPCDRPDVPPLVALNSQNSTTGGSGRTTPTPTDCIPSSPPPSPPSPPQPPRFRRPQLCVCPKPPGSHYGGGGSGSGVPAPGRGGDSGGLGVECVTPLTSLMACSAFITGGAEETPAPTGDCCVALRSFLNISSAATAAGMGDGGLHCLCPVIVGAVNRVLPRPVDPVRLMYLPIACGVVLPPTTLFMCFTGHPSPKVVSRFSTLWEEVAVQG